MSVSRVLALILTPSLLGISAPIALQTSNGNEPDAYVIDLLDAPTIDEVLKEEPTEEETDGPEGVVSTPAPEPAPTTEPDAVVPSSPQLEEDVAPVIPETTEEELVVEDDVNEEPTEPAEPLGDVVLDGDQLMTDNVSLAYVTSPLEYDFMSAPLDTHSFNVAALTWAGSAPQTVEIRTRVNGEWDDWFALELLDPEEGTATEPYISGGADGIQIRSMFAADPVAFELVLLTGAGTQREEIVDDVDVVDELPADDTYAEPAVNNVSGVGLLDSTVQDAVYRPDTMDTTVSDISFATQANITPVDIPAPPIVARKDWGAPANARWRTSTVSLKAAIIHHTAGNNNYTRAQAPSVVSGIRYYHDVTLGWGDIGYNFLVDKYGTIYEGRQGSLNSRDGQMVIGGHARPANTNTVGISVLGNYVSVQPSAAAISAVSDILAWQFGRAGIDPHSTWNHSQVGRLPVIAGHKEVANTACPALIQNQLPNIRNQVKTKVNTAPPLGPAVIGTPYQINSGSPYVTVRPTFIYAEPKTSSSMATALGSSEMVVSTGRATWATPGAWYEVRLGTTVGWVKVSDVAFYSKHSSYKKLLEGSVFTLKNDGNLRNVASEQGLHVRSLEAGTRVETGYHKVGDYWQVRYEGRSAWIKRSVLSASGYRPGEFQIASGNPYVAIDGTPIRSTPQKNGHEAHWLSSQEMAVTTGKAHRNVDGIFYEVRQGSMTGWVEAHEVSFYSKASSYVRLNDGAFFTTVRPTKLLNVAAPRGNEILSVPQGATVEVGYHKVGNYWQVRYGGHTGWVMRKDLSLSGIKPYDYMINRGSAYVTDRATAMFSSPSNDSPVRALSIAEMAVTTGNAHRSLDGHWYEMRQGGTTGWMRASDISFFNKHSSYVALNPGVQAWSVFDTPLLTLASTFGEVRIRIPEGSSMTVGNHKVGAYWQVRFGAYTGWVKREDLSFVRPIR